MRKRQKRNSVILLKEPKCEKKKGELDAVAIFMGFSERTSTFSLGL